jgi:hypothetical protein
MLNRSYIFPFFISLGGYIFMVSMDTVIKVLGSNYPILQLLFFNALFSLLPLTFLIIKNHGWYFYKNQNYKFQFARGCIHTLGFFFVLIGSTETSFICCLSCIIYITFNVAFNVTFYFE